MSEQKSAVAEPEVVVEEQSDRKASRKPPKKQFRYNVILWNDDDHTYDYVIHMLKELFGHKEFRYADRDRSRQDRPRHLPDHHDGTR